jgi:hypothetical protein
MFQQKFWTVLFTVAVDSIRKFPGFINVLVLFSDTEPNVAMVTAFWMAKEDCERYQRES